MQDLGLVTGTSESSGISIPNVQYTQMPTPTQSRLSLHQGRWPLRTEPAGHSQLDTWDSLDQNHTGNEHCHLWNRSRQTGMANIILNESLSALISVGDKRLCVIIRSKWPPLHRTNQSYLGLAVYVFVIRVHTQVSDPLTDVIRLVWTSVVL